jgi:hypothetical protein
VPSQTGAREPDLEGAMTCGAVSRVGPQVEVGAGGSCSDAMTV